MPTGSSTAIGIGTTNINSLVAAGFSTYTQAAATIASTTLGNAQRATRAQPSSSDISPQGLVPSRTAAGVGAAVSTTLIQSLTSRIEISQDAQQIHLERIVVLDEAREPYKIGIARVDNVLIDTIERVNDAIQDVNAAYQARIDSGCKTDLFWRLVQINRQIEATSSTGKGGSGGAQEYYTYTYKCTRLNPTGYPSIPTPTELERLAGLERQLFTAQRGSANPGISQASSFGPSVIGVGSDSVDMIVSDESYPNNLRTFPLNTLHGLERVDLYGVKMYDEPYTADIGETRITSFIGTCGVGTNYVVAMSPINSGGLQNILPGQLLICDKPFVFSSDAYVITQVGVTTANLSGINTVSTRVDSVTVPKLTLDATTIGNAFAPEDSGNYVTFTVLSDPNTLTNLGVGRSISPYIPQTVKCPLTRSDAGKGIRIEFVNNGDPTGSPNWNPFMEGEIDPDADYNLGTGSNAREIDAALDGNRVREPRVGAGRVYHRVGFDVAPVIFTNSERTGYRFATEGETVILRDYQMGQTPPAENSFLTALRNSRNPGGDSAGVVRLPSCSTSISSSLDQAISVSNTEIARLSSTEIQDKVEIANMLREDLMDINLRIWGERQLLGESEERVSTYNGRTDLLQRLGSVLGDL